MSRRGRKRRILRFLRGLAVAVALLWLSFALIRPKNDRNWIPDHEKIPLSTFNGDQMQVRNVRHTQYTSVDSFTVIYEDRQYDLSQISELWYVVSIFDEPNRRGPAHGMLSFGFENGDYVVISVEARKTVGEGYSIYKGMLKRYELVYVVGDERDLILSRAIHRPDNVYLYPISTTPQKIRELFVDMLERSNQLAEKPEFYNTLTKNCTSQLRDHVNRVSPGRIPPTWRTILPGYSDELLVKLGLLEPGGDLDAVRQKYKINSSAAQYADAPDFSQRIRAAFDTN